MPNCLLPITAHQVSIIRKGRRLLNSLDLTITNPGITMIMGPNGAGKSLLLRCLHGLISSDEGEIHFNQNPIEAEIRYRQSMVFQSPTLLRRSVYANLAFVLKDRRMFDPAKIDQALNMVGLTHLATQSARLLSGGEKQRLVLARALLTDPDLLFLDEATSNLDPASTKIIEDILRKVSQADTKIIAITHDLGQAKRLADTIVFMHQGRVCEQTPSDAFFDQPVSREARAFLKGDLLL
jgi:tungstate transport system ATP-binding protein